MLQVCEHKNRALESIDEESVVLYADGFESSCVATIEVYEKHDVLELYTGELNEGKRDTPDIRGDLIATFNARIEVEEDTNTIVIDEEPQLPTFHETVDTETTTIRYTFNNETDSEVFEIPIPFAQAEREGEYLEISADVTVGDKTYTTGIVTIPFSTPTGAILTYITGRLSDGYFEHAKYFWQYRHRSDAVFDPLTQPSDTTPPYSSLEDIVVDIDRFQQANPRTPIQQINIVAHGNPTGVNLLPSTNIIGDGVNNNRLDSLNVEDKLTALTDSMIRPPFEISPSNQFNVEDNVLIVFRGCNIGQNIPLLEGFRQFWGQNVTIQAPKYKQMYYANSFDDDEGIRGVPFEFFENQFILHFKPIQNEDEDENLTYLNFTKVNPPENQRVEVSQKLMSTYNNPRAYNIDSWEIYYDEMMDDTLETNFKVKDSKIKTLLPSNRPEDIKKHEDDFWYFEITNTDLFDENGEVKPEHINTDDGSIKNEVITNIQQRRWDDLEAEKVNFKKINGEASDWHWGNFKILHYEYYDYEVRFSATGEPAGTADWHGYRNIQDPIFEIHPDQPISDDYHWDYTRRIEKTVIGFRQLKSEVLNINSKLFVFTQPEISATQPEVSARQLVIPNLESWEHYGEV